MNSKQPADDNLTPTAITRDGDVAIEITWSDGKTTRWTVADLRKSCPCATCRDERNAKQADSKEEASMTLPVLSAGKSKPLRIDSMRPVGAYAYNIVFSDGHSSGIFTFEMLSRT